MSGYELEQYMVAIMAVCGMIKLNAKSITIAPKPNRAAFNTVMASALTYHSKPAQGNIERVTGKVTKQGIKFFSDRPSFDIASSKKIATQIKAKKVPTGWKAITL